MADKSMKNKRIIGTFTLAMINLAIICSLRGLPILAKEGVSLIFYYLAAAIIFLIPVALVTAELATGWPPNGPGGVYVWVREAFGEKLGFLAIWLQWIQNVIWFPTVLSFLGATIAYIFDPELANNKVYMILIILVAYGGGMVMSFRGMKTSGRISTIGVIVGVFIPFVLIVILGAIWTFTGKVSQISFAVSRLIPDLKDINKIVLLAGALLIFSGVEVSAVHSEEVKDPGRCYPWATFLAGSIALIILMLGSLSISIVVPQKDISLVSGIMEAFQLFLDYFHLKWMVPLVAFLIATGSVGELCSWIVGPSKGLYTTAKHGNLPPFLKHINKNGVPTHIIMVQAIIVTGLSFIFLLMPTVSSSYWILSALCIILYLIMYILLYCAVVKLRYSRPDVDRKYKIPGGKPGIWIISIVGIIGAIFTISISFLPPSQLKTGSIYFYEGFLITGTFLMCAAPFVITRLKKSTWKEEL